MQSIFLELGSRNLLLFWVLMIAAQKQTSSEESAPDSGSTYLSQLTMRGLKARTEDGASAESPRMDPHPTTVQSECCSFTFI